MQVMSVEKGESELLGVGSAYAKNQVLKKFQGHVYNKQETELDAKVGTIITLEIDTNNKEAMTQVLSYFKKDKLLYIKDLDSADNSIIQTLSDFMSGINERKEIALQWPFELKKGETSQFLPIDCINDIVKELREEERQFINNSFFKKYRVKQRGYDFSSGKINCPAQLCLALIISAIDEINSISDAGLRLQKFQSLMTTITKIQALSLSNKLFDKININFNNILNVIYLSLSKMSEKIREEVLRTKFQSTLKKRNLDELLKHSALALGDLILTKPIPVGINNRLLDSNSKFNAKWKVLLSNTLTGDELRSYLGLYRTTSTSEKQIQNKILSFLRKNKMLSKSQQQIALNMSYQSFCEQQFKINFSVKKELFFNAKKSNENILKGLNDSQLHFLFMGDNAEQELELYLNLVFKPLLIGVKLDEIHHIAGNSQIENHLANFSKAYDQFTNTYLPCVSNEFFKTLNIKWIAILPKEKHALIYEHLASIYNNRCELHKISFYLSELLSLTQEVGNFVKVLCGRETEELLKLALLALNKLEHSQNFIMNFYNELYDKVSDDGVKDRIVKSRLDVLKMKDELIDAAENLSFLRDQTTPAAQLEDMARIKKQYKKLSVVAELVATRLSIAMPRLFSIGIKKNQDVGERLLDMIDIKIRRQVEADLSYKLAVNDSQTSLLLEKQASLKEQLLDAEVSLEQKNDEIDLRIQLREEKDTLLQNLILKLEEKLNTKNIDILKSIKSLTEGKKRKERIDNIIFELEKEGYTTIKYQRDAYQVAFEHNKLMTEKKSALYNELSYKNETLTKELKDKQHHIKELKQALNETKEKIAQNQFFIKDYETYKEEQIVKRKITADTHAINLSIYRKQIKKQEQRIMSLQAELDGIDKNTNSGLSEANEKLLLVEKENKHLIQALAKKQDLEHQYNEEVASVKLELEVQKQENEEKKKAYEQNMEGLEQKLKAKEDELIKLKEKDIDREKNSIIRKIFANDKFFLYVFQTKEKLEKYTNKIEDALSSKNISLESLYQIESKVESVMKFHLQDKEKPHSNVYRRVTYKLLLEKAFSNQVINIFKGDGNELAEFEVLLQQITRLDKNNSMKDIIGKINEHVLQHPEHLKEQLEYLRILAEQAKLAFSKLSKTNLIIHAFNNAYREQFAKKVEHKRVKAIKSLWNAKYTQIYESLTSKIQQALVDNNQDLKQLVSRIEAECKQSLKEIYETLDKVEYDGKKLKLSGNNKRSHRSFLYAARDCLYEIFDRKSDVLQAKDEFSAEHAKNYHKQ